MIEILKISSMAIFDELTVEFEPGLNCITGETGAGKSLLIDALTLLMGARASGDIVRPGCDRAVVEALFSHGEGETLVRREITASGRSRCYLDGRLTTVAELAEATANMVSIYGQHQYQDLLHPNQHMRILEETAGLDREAVEGPFREALAAQEHLDNLMRELEELKGEQERMHYSLEELQGLELKAGLEDELVSGLELSRAAEELNLRAHEVLDLLYSGTPSLSDGASLIRDLLLAMANHDAFLAPYADCMQAMQAQVEDITLGIRQRMGRYEYDPQRIEDLEGRLHTLRDLMRKHRTDEEGLMRVREELSRQLSTVEDSRTLLMEARQRLDRARGAYGAGVEAFLCTRQACARLMAERINEDLARLGMPGTRFVVDQREVEGIGTSLCEGADIRNATPNQLLKGEFLISTNVGQNLLPLARVASGGELSRIMLAIRVQQTGSPLATLIFDEIDAGISGETSFMIAHRLREIASQAQAIVVTHLHQVASQADHHLVVSKERRGGSTVSTLRRVTDMDRVMELARMMGGESPSSVVIEHAKELMGSR